MKIKQLKIINQDESTEVADIGADAVNVDYNNTTVKDELDKLNSDNNSVEASLTNLQSQVSGLASGSPLVASSTSEMTDTTRVYVNTTDGKWYYYDGTNWTIGGTYQATINPEFIMKNIPVYGGITNAKQENNVYTFSTSSIYIPYHNKSYSIPAGNYTLENNHQALCIDMEDVYYDDTQENVTLTPVYVNYNTLAINPKYKIIFGDGYGRIITDLTPQYSDYDKLKRINYNKLNLIPFSYANNYGKIVVNQQTNKVSLIGKLLLLGTKNLFTTSNTLVIQPFTDIELTPFELLYILKSEIPSNGIITNELLHHNKYYGNNVYNVDTMIPLLFNDNNGKIKALFDYDIEYTNNVNNPKTLLLGDSISSLKDMSDYINDYNIINGAFPGGSLTKGAGQWYDGISILNISECIKNNDFTTMEASVEHFEQSGSGSAAIMRNHLTTLENLDYSTVNNIIIFAGTNDFNGALMPIGTNIIPSDETFKGYFAKVIENLNNKMPNAKVYIFTPIYRTNALTPNSRNYTLIDYVNAEIEVANYYSIPVKNMYETSNISSITATTYLLSDGLHPTNAGMGILGEKIEKFINFN